MYTKDKQTRITLRLNQKQFDFVKRSADMLDVSPSDFLRMVINQTMVLSNERKDGFCRENEETSIFDIV